MVNGYSCQHKNNMKMISSYLITLWFWQLLNAEKVVPSKYYKDDFQWEFWLQVYIDVFQGVHWT